MKNIKVLGGGCRNCQTTYDLIRQTADELGTEVALEKVQDLAQIMSYGVMSTPAVVIDGRVVHAGGIPDRRTIASWF
jgi:small redox-active disulfide protein 2